MDDNFFGENSFTDNTSWIPEFENNSDPFDLFNESNDFTDGNSVSQATFSSPIASRRLAELFADWTNNLNEGNTSSEDFDPEEIDLEEMTTEENANLSVDNEQIVEVLQSPSSSTEENVVDDVKIQGNFFDDIFHFFWDFGEISPNGTYVPQPAFSNEGNYDTVNHLVVVGNVQDDINFVERQTAGSCSLMAQEQFVHRYLNEKVPEHLLEAIGEREQVYDPEQGTIYEGQTKILDYFNIPYERKHFVSVSRLEKELESNHDCIVGVDARNFYNDPTIPPNAGHAVAVVGKGIDPQTGETMGFYITDSNYPNGAHFVAIDDFKNCWENDMISIPNIKEA